jgi:integrase
MPNKSHSNRQGQQSKTQVVTGDNRKRQPKRRSPEASAKLIAHGVPKALADTFPLTPHDATKRWLKKLKTPHGWKIFYFGPLNDWQSARDRYDAEKKDLINGRTPTARNKDGLTLLDLINRFLHYKRSLVGNDELTMRSWYDQHQCGQRVMQVLGEDALVEELGPDDFEKLRIDYGRTWNAVTIKKQIILARAFFNYAFKMALIDKPIRFGPAFDIPKKQTLKTAKVKKKHQCGKRMFERDELRKIIDGCPQPMKSMVLLAINGGLHNRDVATLPLDVLDLEQGVIDFERGKTGAERIVPLWPLTTASIKEWLVIRPEPKDPEDAGLVFLTKQRLPWYRDGRWVEGDKGGAVVKGIDNPVAKSFRIVLNNLGIKGKQKNFLALRHTFRTKARDARDREAVDFIMGHLDQSMAEHYLEDRLDVERLRAVTDHVHDWLFTDRADQTPDIIPIAAAK